MSQRIDIPFDSLENAQQYIRLLTETVAETKRDINHEVTLATGQMSDRRLQALRVVEYNLDKLERYLSVSGRTLNDLRSLRRLLYGERSATNAAKHHKVAKASDAA